MNKEVREAIRQDKELMEQKRKDFEKGTMLWAIILMGISVLMILFG